MLEDDLIHLLVYRVTLHQHQAEVNASISLYVGHGITSQTTSLHRDVSSSS
jgi:hypothetical protein